MSEIYSPSDRPSSHSPPGAADVRRRILVVDDNPDMARSLAMLLEVLGHEVATAHSGADALVLAREKRPEFILMDIGLPIMNGYQVAARLREEGPGRDAVLVAVSGYSQEEDRRRSREAGFAHHLVKPVELGDILAILAARPSRVE
ncbi:response regulator [Aquisphaera insulae]|uniref:response regulator n=1 Tax=Aquisphaera insulae TaxID=2712864 RepID=UPI0013EC0766|nr:response regulator [Aquisphaera insulae]